MAEEILLTYIQT